MVNDYIRRENMLNAVKKLDIISSVDGMGIPTDTEDFRVQFLGTVLKVEPADVVPVVHGRWIWKPTKQYCPPDCWYPPLSCNEETWDEKNGTWLEDEMYCSECDYHNYHEIKYNFCPNCGVKMDGEE